MRNSNLKSVLAVLFLFLFATCQDKTILSEKESELYTIKKFGIDDFQNEKTLSGKKLNIPQLLYPDLVLALEDYLVISETEDDTLFHIINKSNYKHIRKTGKSGIAPNELKSASSLFKTVRKNQFWGYSLSGKTLAKYNAIDTFANSIEVIKPKNDEMYLASTLVPSAKNSFLSTRNNGDEKFVEFRFDGQILNIFGNWQDMLNMKDVPSNVISSLLQGKLVVNDAKTHFAFACLDADIIEILDKTTGKTISVRGPVHHVPKFTVDYGAGYAMCALDFDDVIYKYIDATIFNNKIYAGFSGHSFETIDINKEDKFVEQIFIFDLDGNPLIRYNLNYSIKHFTVDEDRIYAITYDENPGLVVFDL
ncbi:BF3164 family lipoprotein [Marivirga sp.]|uniref:BF3164 family lipoprotein n=1 Tax=Marivirga sp. TaxID=2018662 RepID=UPI003DA718B2